MVDTTAGNVAAGSANTGSANTGSANTGGVTAGSVTTGSANTAGANTAGANTAGASTAGATGTTTTGAVDVGASTQGGSSGAATTTGGMTGPGPDGFPAQCAEAVELDPSATERMRIQVSLDFDGQPFVFGEPNALPAGGTVLPTNFRLYLSQFAFHEEDQELEAFLVDAQGSPLPYGVQLVNAEDPASLAFDLLARPGAYDGFSFLLGLSQACNQTLSPLAAPLDEASQLKWPHTSGFLFLRFEGNLDELAAPGTPTQIHMGAAAGMDGYAPAFQLGLQSVDSASGLRLNIAVDAILQAAATETDLSDFSLPPPAPPLGDEILAGERLRRAASSVEIFSVAAGP